VKFNPLHDQYDYPGPINGILSAFHTHPHSSWLIIAVDMPLVDENVLKLLFDNRDEKKVATCFTHLVEGLFPEPLLTIWEPSAYPLLLSYVKSGKISPRGFLEIADVKSISVPDERILLNINSPQDKAMFK
jgi:molybdenum cofactor guanylyltransferase